MISAIILAAGESKRMGKPKLLLPLGNSTILEQTAENYVNSKANEVIIVLGYKADEALKLLAGRPMRAAINPAYSLGMSTSIAVGLSLISEKSQAVMIGLADQPFVDTRTINHLVEAFNANKKGIAVPVCRGKQGHPVIFAVKYKEELSGLHGDVGGREVINRHPDDVLEVDVDCEGINIDIDTESGYAAEKEKLNGKK